MFLKTAEAVTYQPLTDVGSVANQLMTTGPSIATGLGTLVNQIFFVVLAIAVVLAVFAIIRGGYLYMTSSDKYTQKQDAKRKIQAAFGGLILAFGTVLILNTINSGLTQFTLFFKPLKTPTEIEQGNSSDENGGGGSNGNNSSSVNPSINTPVVINPDGSYSTVPGSVRIDTDGETPPPFHDPHYQNQTSMPGLDATTDVFVVVPIGSDVPLGTWVHLENQNTGKSAWAFVGDRGPTANGLGEMSLAAATELGSWESGMGNSAHSNHKVTWTFYPNMDRYSP